VRIARTSGTSALRGKPVIVVQTLTDSACAIAASYAAKAFGIKTGTLVREARRLCPAVIPVQANHRLYTDYHDRILTAVDTCLPIEKVMSIDEMACRLMGTERQVPAARELALKIKRALREQVGECLTCSIGIAPNVFLGKVGSDLQKPDGLTVITADNLPDVLLGLELQEIYGIGERMEQRLNRARIFTVAQRTGAVWCLSTAFTNGRKPPPASSPTRSHWPTGGSWRSRDCGRPGAHRPAKGSAASPSSRRCRTNCAPSFITGCR
jgi:nucleotidyltransferase/DNA polymerase involved in DNA repair